MIQAKTAAGPSSAAHTAKLKVSADKFNDIHSLAEAFFRNASLHGNLTAYDQSIRLPNDPEAPRPYTAVTHGESRDRVLRVASCLVELGAKPGDSIGVLSFDRPEWNEAEMAIHAIGGRVVAAYVRDSAERLHYILCDALCKYMFVENQEQLDKLLLLIQRTELDPCRHDRERLELRGIISFEEVTLPDDQQTSLAGTKGWRHLLQEFTHLWPASPRSTPPILTWHDVLAQFPVRPEGSFDHVHTRRDDDACLFYTSGSTGWPKGVAITHGETLENMRQIVISGLLDSQRMLAAESSEEQPVATCLLPERAHVFPARVAQLAAVTPMRLRFPAIVDRKRSQITPEYRASLRRDLHEGGEGIVLAVPKMLIGIEQAVRQQIEEKGRLGRIISRTLARVSKEHLRDAQGIYDPWDRPLQRCLGPLRRVIADRIRSRIVSPKFEFFISGGAKLPLETAGYLWAIGLPVYEGYGSTETNCPIAVNTPEHHRLGSVGRLFDGVETKVDEATRELLVRSRNTAHRYWRLPAETAARWTADGWYRTGDVARLDEDGFLHIEDRVDQLLVLQNGEKVWSADVESRFAAIPYVESALVVGHGRSALVALVSPNEIAVRRWAEKSNTTLEHDWRRQQTVRDLLRREIQEKVNGRAGHEYEQIRHLALIDPPDIEGQTLTATEKIKRSKLEQLHAALVDQLYADRDHWLPISSRTA